MTITKTSERDFAVAAARAIVKQVLKKPDSVMCFATGNTTKPIFDETVRLKRELDVDFSNVFAFNLDEYVGLPADDPASCCYRIRRDLYIPLGIESHYVPTCEAHLADEECKHFAQLLEDLGGIDFMLLSIGQNGHIAFNEPGMPFETSIHIAPISDSTVAAKQDMFGGADKVPRYGITMGIMEICKARHILLAANGASKADILQKGLYGPVTPDIPLSVLRLHNNLSVLADAPAGSLIPTSVEPSK